MNKRRLLKLADLLDADAENKKGIKFDLSIIAKPAIPGEEVDGFSGDFSRGQKPTYDCGTAACAIGLAIVSGAFKREGFKYYISRNNGLQPKYNDSFGFGAAERKFFDLSEAESHFLFLPRSYAGNTPKGAHGERRVAKRIRNFANGKIKVPKKDQDIIW